MTSLVAALRRAAGEDAVLDAPADLAGYGGDLARQADNGILCVVRPRSTAELSEVVKICAAAGIPLTPRGGGTGLAGGACPSAEHGSVVVSFERMRKIRALDTTGNSITVEAGCPLREVQQAATEAGRLLGLDHGGAGSSQIGGNLSTNAGGNTVLRYGMAREQVLGIEAVMSDGSILSQLSPLPKNNAGYDLKQMLIGSEGTLGLITAATLRLRPAAKARGTACIGLASLPSVLAFFTRAQTALGEAISAFEVMPRQCLVFHFAHVGATREPFEPVTPWLVLIEADSASSYFDIERALDDLLATRLEDGLVLAGTIAASEAQRQALWQLREGIAEAMIERPGCLKSDTAVPIGAIPEFVERAASAVAAIVPGCVPVPFGHVGDGNIHFNVLAPLGMQAQAFIARWPSLARAIENAALSLGGTVSAEHGIGLVKRDALERMRTPTELALMRAVKTAFDPDGILNPGKILRGTIN
ncbi:FAD/FMN-containing dehydrogenase [Rhizobiales bacterium GAS191]|nr:FAD/FMN-containing dehydrogenase [Rhizobiales bacterium GAS191]